MRQRDEFMYYTEANKVKMERTNNDTHEKTKKIYYRLSDLVWVS